MLFRVAHPLRFLAEKKPKTAIDSLSVIAAVNGISQFMEHQAVK
jgi:hypothetical protein